MTLVLLGVLHQPLLFDGLHQLDGVLIADRTRFQIGVEDNRFVGQDIEVDLLLLRLGRLGMSVCLVVLFMVNTSIGILSGKNVISILIDEICIFLSSLLSSVTKSSLYMITG